MLLFIKFKALFLLFVALSSLQRDTEASSGNNNADDTEKIHVEADSGEIRYYRDDNGEEVLPSIREAKHEQRQFLDEGASMNSKKVNGFPHQVYSEVFPNRKLTMAGSASGKNSETTRHRRNVLSPAKQPLLKSRAPPSSKDPLTTSSITLRPTTNLVSSSTTSRPPMPPLIPPPPPLPPPPPKQFSPNCSSHLSCRGRCQNNQNQNPNKDAEYLCYCDDHCEIFQDCCADLDMFCPLVNIGLHSSASSLWNCHSDIWMIDQCPRNWPFNEVKSKCVTTDSSLTKDNYADVIPVVSRSGKTYRNRFCAQCHGEHSDNIEHYGLYFDCELSPPQGYSTREAIEFLFEYCTKIQWQTKRDQHKRICIESAENDCTFDHDFPDLLKCHESPTRLVFHEPTNVNYRNAYCASCSMPSEDISSLECGPMLYPPINKLPGSFSIVMNIGGEDMDSKHKTQEIQVDCSNYEVYDIFLELCRPVFQNPSILTSSQFVKYRIALWIKSLMSLRINGNDVVLNFLRNSLDMDNNTKIDIIDWQHVKDQFDIEILIFEVQLWERVQPRRSRRSYEQMSIGSLLNFTRPVRFVFQNNTFIIIKATSRLLTCVHVQYFTPKDYVVVHGSSSIYINQTQELLTEKQYFANSTKNHKGYQIPVGSIAVCRQHLPSISPCNGTYISLDKDEYVMLPNNSVYRNASNTVYNQGEYSIINGSVVVCTEYSNKYTKTQSTDESQNDTALRILTCIGLSLSVVCLVIVLVTYLLFGELRTLPGINLMNLSSALLVAHFFWLIGSGQSGSHCACVAIAVILHYSFLASFAWMSIIAFNTWKIFSSMRSAGASSDNKSRRKKIRCTLAIGWLPVLVLVFICLALDLSGTVEIGYGGPNGCWINNGRANLFIFVLPVAASVVWNAVFFGLTVKAFRKVTEQTRMVKEHRDYNSVYVKIAVLMGFTWIFGFLAPFVSSYFLYPFVALNTIQGVYIAVCFTFTRRVKNLYLTLIAELKINRKNTRETQDTNHMSTDTTRL